MAKNKQKKKQGSKTEPKKSRPNKSNSDTSTPASVSSVESSDRKARASKVTKAARAVGEKAADLATNPVVVEIVAATLVAAAAALKSPKKARDMAKAAGEELESVADGASARGSAMWQLALDIARRSLDALEGETPRDGAGDSAAKKRKPNKKAKK